MCSTFPIKLHFSYNSSLKWYSILRSKFVMFDSPNRLFFLNGFLCHGHFMQRSTTEVKHDKLGCEHEKERSLRGKSHHLCKYHQQFCANCYRCCNFSSRWLIILLSCRTLLAYLLACCLLACLFVCLLVCLCLRSCPPFCIHTK